VSLGEDLVDFEQEEARVALREDVTGLFEDLARVLASLSHRSAEVDHGPCGMDAHLQALELGDRPA
jgi:hypothetical protein